MASHDMADCCAQKTDKKKKKKYSHICILTCYFVTDYKLPLFIGNRRFTYKVRLGQF